jgi:hypothetical protein
VKVLYSIRPRKLFTTENTNDCTDAGGRATHGAVAEDTEKIILLIKYIKNSVFSAIAPALPTWTDICSCNICIHHIPVDYVGT